MPQREVWGWIVTHRGDTAMITLFGATGYTGQLVAQALERRGVPYRLAGRSADKLASLAATLASHPGWVVADVARSETLTCLCRGTRVVINCVGPFTDWGEVIVKQALLAGVRYVDITNELGYVYRLRAYDKLARATGAIVAPACGFEVALADCAADVLAGLVGVSEAVPADSIDVVYDLAGSGSSLGTRRSAVRALATSWLGYRQQRWVGEAPGSRLRRFYLPRGACWALAFPSSEIVTIPAHIPTRQVTAWLITGRLAPLWAPMLVPLFARLAQGMVGRLSVALALLVGPPPAGLRRQAPFTIQVELCHAGRLDKLILTGQGVYDLTAELAAYLAEQMLFLGKEYVGVLPPARIVPPQTLLTEVGRWGVHCHREVE